MEAAARIGLRNALAITKGSGLRFKISTLCRELRYAWQRAWRGYDYSDVFALNENFFERMPILLKEFKKNNNTLFAMRDTGASLTEEETNSILDEMIFYFENCDEDYVYKRLFGADYWADKFDKEKWEVTHGECERCMKEALRLFSEWSWCLWY